MLVYFNLFNLLFNSFCSQTYFYSLVEIFPLNFRMMSKQRHRTEAQIIFYKAVVNRN